MLLQAKDGKNSKLTPEARTVVWGRRSPQPAKGTELAHFRPPEQGDDKGFCFSCPVCGTSLQQL